MNNIRKWFCSVLVMVLLIALLPLEASASTATTTIVSHYGGYTSTISVSVGENPVPVKLQRYVKYCGKYYVYNGGAFFIPGYDGSDAWRATWGTIHIYYEKHSHSYAPGHNRTHHWMGCACGSTYNKQPHVDPAEDADKICTCGYQFSDNADLTTLWLTNVRFDERFRSDVTEYTASTVTYYDVTETDITANLCDDMATLSMPEDTTIKEGSNGFELVVTAEDKTTTKTYTVTVIKPVKVAGLLLNSDGKTVTTNPKTSSLYRIATAKVPDLLVEGMAELAEQDGCKSIVLIPECSKWSNSRIDVPIPVSALKTVAEETELDVSVETRFGAVTIPNKALADLIENCETLTISIEKETSVKLYQDDAEVTGDLLKTVERDLY